MKDGRQLLERCVEGDAALRDAIDLRHDRGTVALDDAIDERPEQVVAERAQHVGHVGCAHLAAAVGDRLVEEAQAVAQAPRRGAAEMRERRLLVRDLLRVEHLLEMARDQLGVDIWTPPGIDLKQDLDELAALSCAMDVVLGFANATSNIAAACGANVWLIAIPGAWVQAGTGRYPWYPQARVFNPAAFREWDGVMSEVAEALEGEVSKD